MTTGREAAGRACGLSLFALLFALSATAQVQPRDSIRLRTTAGDEALTRGHGDGLTSRMLDWGTLTVLVVPDSGDGVMVLAQPRGTDLSAWRGITLDPRLLRSWTGAVRGTLEGGPAAETTPLSIEGARDSGPLVFIPERPDDLQRYQLNFPGCPPQTPLRVRATVENVRQFIDALDYAGRVSVLSKERPADREEAGACDLDRGGEPRMIVRQRITHPLAGRSECTEGTLLLQYVIDAEGRVDTSRLRALYTADPAFTREAISALQDATFRPGAQDGHPVRTRVVQRFNFACH